MYIFSCFWKKSWFAAQEKCIKVQNIDVLIRILSWIESLKEQYLPEIEIFCNIANVFTVAFDQFKASSMNRSIHFF